MKKIILVFFVLMGLNVFAGEGEEKAKTQATWGENNTIVLTSAKGEILDQYKIDVSHLNFESAEQMEQFCRQLIGNLQYFKPDFANQSIYLILRKADVAKFNWTIDTWNNHFAELSDKYTRVYNALVSE